MRKITLTPDEKKLLEVNIKKSTSPVFKRRCECILLAANLGLSPSQLAKHYSVTRKTIYHWFNLWDKSKQEGLRPVGGQGAKKKLASVSVQEIHALMEANHQNLKEVLSLLSSKYKIDVSKRTLIRFLKR